MVDFVYSIIALNIKREGGKTYDVETFTETLETLTEALEAFTEALIKVFFLAAGKHR